MPVPFCSPARSRRRYKRGLAGRRLPPISVRSRAREAAEAEHQRRPSRRREIEPAHRPHDDAAAQRRRLDRAIVEPASQIGDEMHALIGHGDAQRITRMSR
jgi:hypothetical protein